MDLAQALNIIKQACASINAPLATHEQVQAAVGVIEKELAEKPKQDAMPSDPE